MVVSIVAGISHAALLMYLGTAGKEGDEDLALLGLKADDGSQVLLPGGRGKVLLALVAWRGEGVRLFQSRSWLAEWATGQDREGTVIRHEREMGRGGQSRTHDVVEEAHLQAAHGRGGAAC
jgi:hypothetical protein